MALSHRARSQIQSLPQVRRQGTPIIVVPSCVNLDLFPSAPAAPLRGDELRLVYMGVIGGRYLFGDVARFAAVAADELGPVHLRVLSRTDPAVITSLVRRSHLSANSWSLDCVSHDSIPRELRQRHAGLFFLTRGQSEHACSPTKVGEYWACGLPVVTTANVGDLEAIIESERVGVIVRERSDREFRRSARALHTLLDDPELPHRCRRAAESHYALDPACGQQMELYRTIVSHGQRRNRVGS
jgi:glycosyltransferase involved in cell wall biosynthesis